jgi:hypothetical protein
VSDFIDLLARLDPRIRNAQAVLEKRRQIAARQVTVLVDGGGQDATTMLAVPTGVVRAAAKKGDAERSSANYHWRCLWGSSQRAAKKLAASA